MSNVKCGPLGLGHWSRLAVMVIMLALLSVGAARPLTVEECVQLGLQNNPTLVASQAGVDYAQARQREALAARLPSLKLTGGYTRVNPVDPFVFTLPTKPPIAETIVPSITNNYQAKLTLQQPLFTGFRLHNTGLIAGENAQAAGNDLARDRAQLVYDVRSGYWRLFQAVKSQATVEGNIKRMQAHLADIKNLQTHGMATRNDVLKVQVQVSNVELAAVDARNGVQVAMTALNNLIGLPLSTDIEPISETGAKAGGSASGEDSLPALITNAQERRPEIKSLEARVRASADGVNLARAAWYPQIVASGDFVYARPNQRVFPSQDKFMPSWDAGVGMSFDVWNWGTAAHQTAEAKAQFRQAQASLTQLKNGIALQVTQDFLSLQKAQAKVAVAETAVVQAEENQRVARDGFAAGTVISADLLDAEVNLLQAQLNLTQAQADLEIGRAKLEQTLGEK
jgi:outer membrane protein